MSWILYIFVGYAGSHSTMTTHGAFRTNQDCEVAGRMAASKQIHRARIEFLCVPKEKH